MDFDIQLSKLEELRSNLAEDPTLTPSQEKSLSTTIELIKERQADRSKYSEAKRSRRKSARTLLSTIQERLGPVILFLCSTALSINKLYQINSQATTFISELDAWKNNVEFSRDIVDLAERHLTVDLLSCLGSDEAHTRLLKRGAHFDGGTAKRLRTEPSTPKNVTIPTYHGVLELATQQPSTRTPTDAHDGDSHGETGRNKEGSEDSDDSDDSDVGEVESAEALQDHSHSAPKDDGDSPIFVMSQNFPELTRVVQLYANVYQLRDMEVVRVIASQRENFTARLTVPHIPGATPFITIHCPRTLATEYVTRKQVTW
ncbi:hypothetical protein FOQG_15983 [Fusarium oxysporum f. sp. raphani 54005]|uniref:Uncharacterized protein n=1 Tax=Fusarium oxysporum f. sp. raphani 54005 TaxID=1089458 RepID=X0BCB2_FUSOX|nr:hypothetical protein FOQG_15983 [Fusarium oxysporum f. sp. raphani 54005]